MKKKNKFLYLLYLFLFIIFYFTYYSLEKSYISDKIEKVYDLDKISTTNHLRVKIKYKSIPSVYLENCLFKLMSWNYEKDYDCYSYSEISTIRYFSQTSDKQYYYLTDRNKNVGYYILYVIKENFGAFSNKEKKEFFDEFYSFVEKEYLRSDFDFNYYEEKNQNFKYKYFAFLNQYYGSIKKYDVKDKFNLQVKIFDKKPDFNALNFIFIENFLVSLISTVLTIFIARKFYFKK